jgi:hypothetical protein
MKGVVVFYLCPGPNHLHLSQQAIGSLVMMCGTKRQIQRIEHGNPRSPTILHCTEVQSHNKGKFQFSFPPSIRRSEVTHTRAKRGLALFLEEAIHPLSLKKRVVREGP